MQSQINLTIEPLKNVENACVVHFIGDLDATNVDHVVDGVFELLNQGTIRIIADFSNLRYVNSTGLGILLHFSKTAKEKGGCFKIIHVNENVYEIIEIIGTTTLLELYDSLEDALSSIQ